MRHCVFVVASPSQLKALHPTIESIAEAGLAVSVIADGIDVANVDVVATRIRDWPRLSQLLSLPMMMSTCLQHVAAIKTWTTKRPLVVVQGSQLSSWLAATAARWGGGNIVYVDRNEDNAGFFARSFRRMAAAKAHLKVAASDQVDQTILALIGVRNAH